MKTDRSEISNQEVAVFLALKGAGDWKTSRELSIDAKVSERTARKYTRKFTQAGLCEIIKTYPGYRFLLHSSYRTKNKELSANLERAASAFNL